MTTPAELAELMLRVKAQRIAQFADLNDDQLLELMEETKADLEEIEDEIERRGI